MKKLRLTKKGFPVGYSKYDAFTWRHPSDGQFGIFARKGYMKRTDYAFGAWAEGNPPGYVFAGAATQLFRFERLGAKVWDFLKEENKRGDN